MRLVWCLILIIMLLTSCGGEQPVPEATSMPIPEVTPIDYTNSFENRDPDPSLAPYMAVLDSVYSSAPLYFMDGDQLFFYVINGEWPDVWEQTPDSTFQYKMGIVSGQFDTILPIAYSKIYTPNGTAKGYIEIEAEGKRGLVNYHTKQLIPATFDVIFPSHTEGIVAVGKRGNQHYNILTNGSEQLITDRAKVPTYLSMQKDLAYDIKKAPQLLIDTRYRDDRTRINIGYMYNRGILIAPSYLVATGFVDEWVMGIDISELEVSFSLTESRSHVEQAKTTRWGFDLLISDFYTEGIDGRSSYSYHSKHVATIDSNNNVVGKAMFSTEYNDDDPFFECSYPEKSYQLIGDSLLEVVTLKSILFGQTDDHRYQAYPEYRYYAILKGGQIQKLDSHREFPFTKYVYINESYFKGCYVIDKDAKNDTLKWPVNEDQSLFVSSYLTVGDLDLMYNEILAEYGYKFKDAEWDKYFRGKPWYNPQFKNVDDRLNKYEKANLAVIKAARAKLIQNPEKRLNGVFQSYY